MGEEYDKLKKLDEIDEEANEKVEEKPVKKKATKKKVTRKKTTRKKAAEKVVEPEVVDVSKEFDALWDKNYKEHRNMFNYFAKEFGVKLREQDARRICGHGLTVKDLCKVLYANERLS